MSPHQDGQLPPVAPRGDVAERYVGHTTFETLPGMVDFLAPCPGGDHLCLWESDRVTDQTLPVSCYVCWPGLARLRDVAAKLSGSA